MNHATALPDQRGLDSVDDIVRQLLSIVVVIGKVKVEVDKNVMLLSNESIYLMMIDVYGRLDEMVLTRDDVDCVMIG